MNNSVHHTIDTFFASYPLGTYPKGHILLFPGERSEKVYYLLTGRVCQYDISYRGDDIIVNSFKPPAFFPMALAISQKSGNFFYKTEAKTSARIAPAYDVVEFMHQQPLIVFDLLSRVYTGTESILERMVRLMSGTAKSRIVFELIIELRRFGVINGNTGYIEVTEASIAARSGLSRETVSREMGHLKAKDLVHIDSHKIHFSDIDRLEKELGIHV